MKAWIAFGIVALLSGCTAGDPMGPSPPGALSTRPTLRAVVPRLPAGAGRLALVLPEGRSMRDAVRDLRRAGNRVLAVVPPRTIVLQTGATARETLLAAFPGAVAAASPGDPVLDRLSGADKASVAAFLAPPPAASPDAGVVREFPPTPPHADRLVTFDGDPRNNVVEFLQGLIVVAVILPDSTGAIDPKTEAWTDETVAQQKSRIAEGVMRFLEYDPTRNASFVLHYASANPAGPADTVACDYETVDYSNWMYGNDPIPWSDVLGRLGFPAGQAGPPYVAYLNHLRDTYGADWAFLIKVVNESNAMAGGAPGNNAHADIYGPTTTIYSTNGSEVITHELGHIFGALDEYCNPSTVCPDPTARIGYLGVVDANATGQSGLGHSAGFGEQAPSLMSFNDVHHITPYTMQAWGFSDSDGDGIQDVHSPFPDTELTDAEAEEDGGLRVEGLARVLPLATVFAKPPGSSLREIASVECRVDGNAWQPAEPMDGAFDSGVEAFRCPWTRAPVGFHRVEARAVNDFGRVERSPARKRVRVKESAVAEMPLFASLKVSPATASKGMEVRLDASASTGVPGGMSFRFDIDGDGTFDTGPSAEPVQFVTALDPGVHESGVEVSAPGRDPVVAKVVWTVASADLPPEAKLSMPGGDRAFGNPEPAFAFDASASSDPEGSPLSFRWQVRANDESLDTGFGPDATFEYRPTLTGTLAWQSLYTPQKVWIQAVALRDDVLLTGDEGFGLHVVSLKDPGGPALLGTLALPAGVDGAPGAWDVAWIGKDRALAVGPGGTFGVDLADPAAPEIASTTGALRGVISRVSGTTGYVGGAEGLVAVDLSDPAVLVPGVTLATGKIGLFEVAGKWAFLQAGGPVTLLDLDDPAHPAPAATLPALADRAIQVTGKRGYAWDFLGHVTVFDPAALPSWSELGAFDLGPSTPRWFDDERVFADRGDLLEVRDLTEPSHPVLVGRGVPFAGVSLVRSLGPDRIVSAFMGLVQTTRWADLGFDRSLGVRADVIVRDGAGQESMAGAYAWANPYDSPPVMDVTVDPAGGGPGTVFTFHLAMTDPDLGTTWDGLLSWRADLDGDGNWDGPFVELGPGVTTASATVVHPAPGGYDAVFEVSDRFRAVARRTVHVEVDGPEVPALSGLEPDTSGPGVEEWIEVHGASLDFPLDALDLGPGIEVLQAQPLDPGRMRVRIRVAEDAAAGPRDVTATFADGIPASLPGGFAIVPCAIRVVPDTLLEVPRNTMVKLSALGGANPQFEAPVGLESWGSLQSDGLYTSGPRAGTDRLRARSVACCDGSGQPVEDCRPTAVTIRVRKGDDDRVIRYLSPAGGQAVGGDPAGWTGTAHMSDVAGVSDLWLFLWLEGAPLEALSGTLAAPSGKKVAVLTPASPSVGSFLYGWAPFQWTPKESLEAFKGEDPRGDWTLTVLDSLPGSTVEVRQWTLAIAGPEAPGSWDWQPPAAIADLSAAWDGGLGVLLSWTAPADLPGGGQVDRYEIRFAAEPLRYWNWFTTGTVAVHASPAGPGKPDSFEFESLPPGTTWFGIRALDSHANYGPISNLATVEVPAVVESDEGEPEPLEPGPDLADPVADVSGEGADPTWAEETGSADPGPVPEEIPDGQSGPDTAEDVRDPDATPTDTQPPESEVGRSSGCGCRTGPGEAGGAGPWILLGILLTLGTWHRGIGARE